MPTQTAQTPTTKARPPGAPTPAPFGTARRPGPPKPVVFKDFASI